MIHNSQHTHDQQSIVAQCSPQGRGAIGLIRICGIDAVSIVNQVVRKSLSSALSHTIVYGGVYDEHDVIIDRVLFLIMHGPKTFTGQDTIEITCHNNQFIIDAIITRLINAGARLAEPGEFSKRAYLNGKVDLLQAEAIDELIQANNQAALKKSLAQLDGSLSEWSRRIEIQLMMLLALVQASFEFLDDDAISFDDQIRTILEETLALLATVTVRFNQQSLIRTGAKIAFVGSVNAGKSSLFNALSDQNRAIVTDIAGTTRDVIEVGMYVAGQYWTLADTAGLRTTEDVIEQQGIERSRQQAELADILLLIVDAARDMTADEQQIYQELHNRHKEKTVLVYNKADVVASSDMIVNRMSLSKAHQKQILLPADIRTCAHDQASVHALHKLIAEKIATLIADTASPFLLNKRQYMILSTVERELQRMRSVYADTIAYELLAYDLKDSLEKLSELTGATISEESMDMIFKSFCVGK